MKGHRNFKYTMHVLKPVYTFALYSLVAESPDFPSVHNSICIAYVFPTPVLHIEKIYLGDIGINYIRWLSCHDSAVNNLEPHFWSLYRFV